MAYYRLIMRDETYFKFLAIASKMNKSPGKLLNELIESFVNIKYKELFGDTDEAKGR